MSWKDTRDHGAGWCAASIAVLTIALAAVFFGIALYINVAEQPARLALDDAPLLAQWKISFGVGIAIQGSLAIATGLAALAAGWFSRDWRWLVGGLLMLANWPWTLTMIAPINTALLSTAAESAGPASRLLIEQWGQMHAVRTGLSLVALLLFLWAAGRELRPLAIARLAPTTTAP